jgi:hypothetical protein
LVIGIAISAPAMPAISPASGDQEGQTEPRLKQDVGVAADGEERGMAEARLSRLADEDHQPHAGDGPDQHVGRLAEREGGQHEGQRQRQREQRQIPAELLLVAEEVDVGVVGRLENGSHALTPSSRGPGRGCRAVGKSG